MTDNMLEPTVPTGRVSRIVIGAGIALAVVAIIGVVLVVRFVDAERERDLQSWQIRLGIVADTRTAEVNEWLEAQFSTLQELAENASLQLYMTELMLMEGEIFAEEPAELSYLRNLLVATAQRNRFTAPVAQLAVDANVERLGVAGIALTDRDGDIVAATPEMPAQTAAMRNAMERALGGETALIDLHLGPSRQPTIGFVVPVYAIQADQGGSDTIGLVVGLKIVGEELYRRLEQPGETATTATSYLVRIAGDTVEYLSPLDDGTPPLRRSLAVDTPELAASFVAESPGGFAVRRDHKGEEVLVTGRRIAIAPWYLVRTVTAAEALTEIERRARTMLIVFLLIIAGISVALVAVWRHGTSLKAAQAAEKFRITAMRFENVTQFLRVVTDGIPDPIIGLDDQGRFTFANMTVARRAGLHPRDIIGKPLASVVGPERARYFQAINEEVVRTQKARSETHTFEDGEDGPEIVISDHLPLPQTEARPAGVLMLVRDITEIARERRRREQTLRQLVRTLVTVADSRDPFSAHHSQWVAEVSTAIATEMGLGEVERDTVETAANLINLGKMTVPVHVLTKTGDLTAEERRLVQDSVRAGADLLAEVDFDGPVVPTLRQIQERWDGTGPLGMRGDDIEIGARIIAVANAFVGMVSARAYRNAMPLDEACRILLEQAGSAYDRRTVTALINVVENRGGRENWHRFSAPPAEGSGSPVDSSAPPHPPADRH